LTETIQREELEAQGWAAEARTVLQRAGFEVDSCIVQGNPNHVILEQAAKLRADLIALGAHGHWAINRLVVGSTADYVANNARCSVLICRSDGAPHAEGRDVLIAYDGSAPATQAYADAMKLEWPESTRLQVFYALEKPRLIADDEDYDPQAIAEANETLKQLAANRTHKCQVLNTVGERTHVGNSIQSKVERDNVDLLFMGASDKSAVARFFLGSVGRYLLHNCGCSLWIARPKS
jgi:nucleotide-binding universal stress UspA family protein